jgi:D-alanyl-D-alanine carboxypeptidase/D-alanyl-D-alanine-endopeptidase (penicillin-binding protein 4)
MRWYALLALIPLAAAAQGIPAPVADELKRAGVPPESVALIVREAGGDRTLVSHQAAKPMNPASVMKLATTAAALDLLGPAFAFKTEIFTRGKVQGGVLDGDLYVKGSADPKLTYEKLWMAVRQLKERGIREIKGDLVLDRSYLAPIEHDAARFDGKARRAYNVGPDALLLNFKVVTLRFVPGDRDSRAVTVFSDPPMPNVQIVNRVKLAAGGCGDWQERLQLDVKETGLQATLQLDGSFAESCGERAWHVSVFDHAGYDEALLRWLWTEAGGKLHGKVRESTVPADAWPVYAIESPPLADLAKDVNKFSNNVMARQIFLALSAEMDKQPGNTARSTAIVKDWLKARGIEAPELVMENGSGLSRVERMSAGNIAALIDAMWKRALMPEFLSSLSLAAVDGTFKKRVNNEGVAGQAHLKGGTLNDVRAIAGQVLDHSGKRWTVVFMVNHPNAPSSQSAQDVLLRWIYER